MRPSPHPLALIALLAAAAALADDAPPRRLGDHPAIVVQRLHRDAGYDYASKFYPHPAWLYLRTEPAFDAAALARAPRAPTRSDPRRTGGDAAD